MTPCFYSCKKCDRIWCVAGDDPGRHLLKKVMPCPNRSSCGSNVREVTKADSKRSWSSVTAIQLYQASMGTGLPEERQCGLPEVKKALIGAKITAAVLEKSPDPSRSLISSLRLDTGKTIHFATSTKGAVIYKITEGPDVR